MHYTYDLYTDIRNSYMEKVAAFPTAMFSNLYRQGVSKTLTPDAATTSFLRRNTGWQGLIASQLRHELKSIAGALIGGGAGLGGALATGAEELIPAGALAGALGGGLYGLGNEMLRANPGAHIIF